MQVCCLRSKRGQQCVSARNKALAQFWCSLFIQHLSVRLEAIDFAAAVHLPSDKLEAHDLTLGLSVGPRRGDCRPNRRFILRDAIGEREIDRGFRSRNWIPYLSSTLMARAASFILSDFLVLPMTSEMLRKIPRPGLRCPLRSLCRIIGLRLRHQRKQVNAIVYCRARPLIEQLPSVCRAGFSQAPGLARSKSILTFLVY